MVLAIAAGVAVARRRHRGALALAIAWAVLAVGFWTFAFARPYGVLQDAAVTRWAADVSVAGSGDGGFLAGEETGHPAWSRLARRFGAEPILLAPTLVPMAVIPGIAVLIAITRRSRAGALAAILWMAVCSLDTDVVRGVALVPALWPMTMGAHGAIAPWDVPGLLLLDAFPWVALAAVALRSHRDPAGVALIGGGAVAVAAAAFGAGDAVVAAAVYRAGLVVAAAPLIVRLSDRCAVPIPLGRERVWTADGAALRGAIVATALAGSFLTWWDPPRLDAVARASLEPIPAGVASSMDWIRTRTDPAAAFVAGEDYAAAVAVLGGRRVLRAPSLATAPDEERRVRAERAVLSGRRVDALVARYGLRYVLLAPGQFRAHGLEDPWPIEATDAVLVHRNAAGLRVYELAGASR